MSDQQTSHWERLRASEASLADSVKQASSRAYLYGLEDNGASALSRRKRAVKDSIATRKYFIAQIEKRQAGTTKLPPRPQDEADRFIVAHREAIRRLEEQKADVRPVVNIIAPMTRRVAREDRRRANKQPKTSTERH